MTLFNPFSPSDDIWRSKKAQISGSKYHNSLPALIFKEFGLSVLERA